MHVVIVSDYGTINGGAASVAIRSARALAERGHQISFMCSVEPIDSHLEHANISIHHLGFRDVWAELNPVRAALRGTWNAEAARFLAELLAQLNHGETIVHFHQWTRAMSPSVIAATARGGFCQAFTLHDYFLFCPNGLYFDHARRRPCSRRPLSPSCLLAACDTRSRAHKAVRVARQIGSDAALRRVPRPLNLVHVSHSARDVARVHLPSHSRHFVVPNPSTMPKLAPVAVRTNDTFVYIGRFTPEKGAVAFARAARATSLRAVFLGAGPDCERIQRADPEAEIRPWSADGVVGRLLEQARALVFPSLWHETSGLVVLEALSKGVPVVCSRGTGAADWIEHGINGFLVPPGEIAPLEESLARLRDDDDLAEQMGRRAYERYWRDAPTISAHAERLESCYRTILSSRSARPTAAET